VSSLNLKLILKRGALIAAANWPTVAIQFVAETAFQVLVAIPILGAAVLVTVVVGTDLAELLQGGLRDMATRIAGALTSEPIALVSFGVAFGITLAAASVLMFLTKGGVLDVLLAAEESAGPFEREPISIDTIEPAACFTLERFVNGCARLFKPYLALGIVLLAAYALTAAAYVAFAVYGYRVAGALGVVGLTSLAAVAAIVLIVWITLVNFVYLLMQIAMAADKLGVNDAFRAVAAFMRGEAALLAKIFFVTLGIEIGATLVSALAWSALGLIAFVPLVGLAVIPLQIVALAVRGLAFAYIGLTAASAYLALYRREPRAMARSNRAVMAQPLGPPESGSVAG
jgi:hypothetical protein